MSRRFLIQRETDIYTLAELSREFLLPERIRIKLVSIERKASLDIGCLVYTCRSFENGHGRAANPVQVDLDSLAPERRDLIRLIIDHIYVSGLRETSILTYYKNVKVVMDWCDRNDHSSWVHSVHDAGVAYVAFSHYLKHQILVLGALAPSTCATRQRTFQHLIEICFGADAEHVLHLASAISVPRTPIAPPSEIAVRQYVTTCLDLAKKLSRFILEGQKFPVRLSIGERDAVIFPSLKGIITQFNKDKRLRTSYHAEELRITTAEEFYDRTGSEWSDCVKAVESAQANLDAANIDLRSEARMRLASMAASAYACVFLLITAANPSEFVLFNFLEALEVENSMVKKELTSIKFRANGRVTRYAVGRRTGLPLLRDYLKLRAWILGGASSEYLFFKMKRSGKYTGEYAKLSDSFTSGFFKRIRGVFLSEDAANIPGSSARKLKSLVLHELRISPSVVADVLNHTEAVNFSSYSETTPERMKQEYGNFWQAVRKAAEMVKERTGQDATKIATGRCGDFDRPLKISDVVAIVPDCRTQYGCLFCKNYLCHADEEDIHKLTSLQYVVSAVRTGASDIGHAEQTFRELSIRVDFILQAISERSEESMRTVDDIKYRVHELGELTHFWERRLQRYEHVGVIF